MDKNANQTLDPKLKEIYERVMSTQVKPVAPTTQPTPAGQNPLDSAQPAPVQPQVAQPQPIAPPPAATPPQVMQANVTFANAQAGGKQEAAGKKKGLSPIFTVITGFVFFVIYALFWLKFFNIPIPFLPQ